MKRIGIVGSDNSHAIAYSRLINVARVAGDDAAVTTIWGQASERTQEVARIGDIPTIAPSIDAMLPEVDIVFVVDRHGDLHADHVLPFLEAGIPAYVDKPLAISLADCRRILDAADRTGTFVTSFSSLRITPETIALVERAREIGDLRAVQITGPCDFASEYGGPFFYATHTIEIAIAILGDGIASLRAQRIGTSVIVNATWEGDRAVTLTLLEGAHYVFHAAIFGTNGFLSEQIHADDHGYTAIIHRVLEGIATNTRPLNNRQLRLPIAIIHAIEESLAHHGTEVTIAPFLGESGV